MRNESPPPALCASINLFSRRSPINQSMLPMKSKPVRAHHVVVPQPCKIACDHNTKLKRTCVWMMGLGFAPKQFQFQYCKAGANHEEEDEYYIKRAKNKNMRQSNGMDRKKVIFINFTFESTADQADTMCEQIMDDEKKSREIDLRRWKRDRDRERNGMKWVNHRIGLHVFVLSTVCLAIVLASTKTIVARKTPNDEPIIHFKQHSFVMCMDVNYDYDHHIKCTVGFLLEPFSSLRSLFKWI